MRGYSPPHWKESMALEVAWCGNGSSQHGLFTALCTRKQRTHTGSGAGLYTKLIPFPPRNPLLSSRLLLHKSHNLPKQWHPLSVPSIQMFEPTRSIIYSTYNNFKDRFLKCFSTILSRIIQSSKTHEISVVCIEYCPPWIRKTTRSQLLLWYPSIWLKIKPCSTYTSKDIQQFQKILLVFRTEWSEWHLVGRGQRCR